MGEAGQKNIKHNNSSTGRSTTPFPWTGWWEAIMTAYVFFLINFTFAAI